MIKFSLYIYNIQENVTIDVQVIHYIRIVCDGTYLCPVSVKYHYHDSLNKNNTKTLVYLCTIVNVNVKVIKEITDYVIQSGLN